MAHLIWLEGKIMKHAAIPYSVRDSQHMRDFTLAASTERPEVAHIQTHLIFEFQRNTELANLLQR